MLLLTAAIAGPLWLAGQAVTAPLQRLLYETQHAWRVQRPTRQNGAHSVGDEITQLELLVHRHTLRAYRQARAVNHLRRTLDHRVERATRMATHQLEQMAMRDPLTGLGNRRFLDEHLDALTASCRSSETDLICLAMDLDNFKPINDTLGHTAGDNLLKFLAELIEGNIRRHDLAIRLGGDEFLILMPGVAMRPAAEFVQRLRQLFDQHVRTTLPRSLSTGLSVGLASLRQDGAKSGAALIDQADRRLYAAKTAGKNRLATHNGEGAGQGEIG